MKSSTSFSFQTGSSRRVIVAAEKAPRPRTRRTGTRRPKARRRAVVNRRPAGDQIDEARGTRRKPPARLVQPAVDSRRPRNTVRRIMGDVRRRAREKDQSLPSSFRNLLVVQERGMERGRLDGCCVTFRNAVAALLRFATITTGVRPRASSYNTLLFPAILGGASPSPAALPGIPRFLGPDISFTCPSSPATR